MSSPRSTSSKPITAWLMQQIRAFSDYVYYSLPPGSLPGAGRFIERRLWPSHLTLLVSSNRGKALSFTVVSLRKWTRQQRVCSELGFILKYWMDGRSVEIGPALSLGSRPETIR